MPPSKIVTADQMRALEQAAFDAGTTWPALMEQAGWGVAHVGLSMLGDPRAARAVVLAGPGNNGGDALVAARHLCDAGVRTTLYLWRRTANTDQNFQRCAARDMTIFFANDDPTQQQLASLLEDADLVIDGLLGIGVRRPVAGELAQMISLINQRNSSTSAKVLAIDVPSGLNADTGQPWGDMVRADTTVATGALKRGLLLYPGRSYAGMLDVAEIGVSARQMETCMSEQITPSMVRALLPARPDDSHKGTYGKAMIVAGSLLYPGAATLCSASALRVGAGLVTLATGRSGLGAPGRQPEITLRPLPDSGMGALGEESAAELLKHIGGYTVLLIGPGLGHEDPTKAFMTRLLGLNKPKQRSHIGFRPAQTQEQAATDRVELPLVIDADGLNILAEIENWWEHIPAERAVLTPHPGEMKRLLKAEELPDDPVATAEQAAAEWKQIVVLKGATTVVAHPDGRTALLDGGNAALATAGTGDVLAGAITGLIAQGLALFDAAVCGVFLHGSAGRLVREDLGDAGTIASDLLIRLPQAIKTVKA